MKLTYHYLNDPYHCVFRLSAILSHTQQRYEVDALRIFDFLLIFQHLIPEMRWTRELRREIKSLGIDNARALYVKLPGKKVLFRDLAQIQTIALSHMVGRGLLDKNDFIDGIVALVERPSSPMAEMLNAFQEEKSTLFMFFAGIAKSLPVRGVDGLKDRSGLMEYRYDASL